MKVKPTEMLWMIPAGRLNHRPRAAWRAPKALLQGHLMERMNNFTLLDDAMQGFGGAAAGGVGEIGRRRQLVGLHDPGSERRRLFGVGESPAEAGAGAKQERDGRGCDAWRCKTGLHEPAKRTKICTKRARLALGCLSVRFISLYFTSTSALLTSTYKPCLRTEDPCVAGSGEPLLELVFNDLTEWLALTVGTGRVASTRRRNRLRAGGRVRGWF